MQEQQAHPAAAASPVVWGTPQYNDLWQMAVAVGEQQQARGVLHAAPWCRSCNAALAAFFTPSQLHSSPCLQAAAMLACSSVIKLEMWCNDSYQGLHIPSVSALVYC